MAVEPLPSASLPIPETLDAAIVGIEEAALALHSLARRARERAENALAETESAEPKPEPSGEPSAAIAEAETQLCDLRTAIERAEQELERITRQRATTRDEHKRATYELEELLGKSARVREQML